jgi:hypothetical protein
MAKKKRAKREFVVGYKGDRQCVYGPDRDRPINSDVAWCDRMTLFTARRRLAKMSSLDSDRVIYRLVPYEVVKGKKGAR